ncbi:zinc transporter ZIP1-like isoform X2 [Tigriopus californicus]|uniref:zinc transporter ZIP1-like isoform X2 n=1 Tax=Tigriopus californicus TaxID=6832 RepID=UPI0027DA3FF6|nr:zinc transporter ZIP1-like isoform X2 [Tigriopus californicus]
MNLVTAKIIALFLLGGGSVVLGFIPIKLRRQLGWTEQTSQNRKKLILTSIALCFGGGVLLATCFIHMLPEVRDGLFHSHRDFDAIPVAEILLCCGFFLIYMIEELVFFASKAGWMGSSVGHGTLGALQRTFSLRGAGPSTSSTLERDLAPQSMEIDGIPPTETPSMEQETSDNPKVFNPKYAVNLSTSAQSMFPNYHSPDGPVNTSASTAVTQKRAAAFKDFITILALSFHAIFEGLAVGLEETVRDVWTLFIAIATHKFVIIFCIGLELAINETPIKSFTLYMLTFALVSPLGIAIGILIAEASAFDPEGHSLVVGILQGLAAGTILYVVVFEVLQRERTKSVPGLLQFSFVVLGFCTLLCIELFVGHHHDHSLGSTLTTPSPKDHHHEGDGARPLILTPQSHDHLTDLDNQVQTAIGLDFDTNQTDPNDLYLSTQTLSLLWRKWSKQTLNHEWRDGQ